VLVAAMVMHRVLTVIGDVFAYTVAFAVAKKREAV